VDQNTITRTVAAPPPKATRRDRTAGRLRATAPRPRRAAMHAPSPKASSCPTVWPTKRGTSRARSKPVAETSPPQSTFTRLSGRENARRAIRQRPSGPIPVTRHRPSDSPRHLADMVELALGAQPRGDDVTSAPDANEARRRLDAYAYLSAPERLSTSRSRGSSAGRSWLTWPSRTSWRTCVRPAALPPDAGNPTTTSRQSPGRCGLGPGTRACHGRARSGAP
jgi:hypothetical protein